ncbi:trehalose operon repressor [Pontibacillus yanchengensis]|uniref:Trehalose operon repressor n=2 Tax=Pontibacillus yanchengensis TaxID=462910 RepID=A0ACC7VHZ4_9BACI|nr:trehalose operon repressor [Pontibacillus yanchengensis]MYL36012.1 trehalose operon repressor [Pontibacillus yanchengensis]MYL54408.1 trehalose operon repressor [Pontibacillus yanchengensis]
MQQNKFMSIYQDIVEKIKKEVYKVGEKLPSENELSQTYETSRETIRKALNRLSQHGYIQKVRGKGSIVLDIKKFDFPVSGLVSFKELADDMGEPPVTEVHELSLSSPEEHIRSAMELDDEDLIWHVTRSRSFQGEKIILDKDYILYSQVPKLTKSICEESIYAYLEQELELKISFAKKEITVEEPTNEDERCLDLKDYPNVVVIKNFVYLDDTTLFQYTESRHRPDKFRFVDFARR